MGYQQKANSERKACVTQQQRQAEVRKHFGGGSCSMKQRGSGESLCMMEQFHTG